MMSTPMTQHHATTKCPDCHARLIDRPYGKRCPHCDVMGAAPEPEWELPDSTVADICRAEAATAAMLEARGLR